MGPVQKAVEGSFGNRPIGMPSLAAIAQETARFGLPDSDAEALYDAWLSSGFRLKGGGKIKDWKAALRTWHRNEWFPSQRRSQGAGQRRSHFDITRAFCDQHFKARKQFHWVILGRYAYEKLLANNFYWAKSPIDSEERAHAVLEQIGEIYFRENR